MSDYTSNLGNYCPNPSAPDNQHEPAEYKISPDNTIAKYDTIIEMNDELEIPSNNYQAGIEDRWCKWCGCRYGVSIVDTE